MDLLTLSYHIGWYLISSPIKITSKPPTKWNISYLLDCWLGISSVDNLNLWLLGAPIYLSPIGLQTVENSWCVFRIYRDLLRKIQSFGSICIVGDIVRIETTTPLVVTRDNDNGSERTLMIKEQYSENITQLIPFLQVTIVVDTLSNHQGRSLPSYPLIEIFLTSRIVDLVFHLLTFYTYDCWARLYKFLQLD